MRRIYGAEHGVSDEAARGAGFGSVFIVCANAGINLQNRERKF
jgi:hypothetical protein